MRRSSSTVVGPLAASPFGPAWSLASGSWTVVPGSTSATLPGPNDTFVPIDFARPWNFDTLGISVVAAGSPGDTLRAGLFPDTGDGSAPGVCVLDMGTIDLSTAGAKNLSVTPTLRSAGRWWIGFRRVVAGAPTVRCVTALPAPVPLGTLATPTSGNIGSVASTVVATGPWSLVSAPVIDDTASVAVRFALRGS